MRCSHCKKDRDISEFHKSSHRCKVCDREKNKKMRASPKGRFQVYKSGARTRHIFFGITFKDFMDFWNKDCFYCETRIAGVGIDRKNRALGYIKANLVPCCRSCNYFKGWIEGRIARTKKVSQKSIKKILQTLLVC